MYAQCALPCALHTVQLYKNSYHSAGFNRQILTATVDLRTVRIKVFIMAVDIQHGYSN